jgi:hypothetical protein
VVSAATRWSAAEHEAGLALLVAPGQPRQRLRTLLALAASDPYRREELVRMFPAWMDPRFTRRAGPARGGVAPDQRLLGILQAKGAPKTCYMLSDDENLDGRELPLDEALSSAVYGSRIYVYLASCVPGRLGFYVDGEWYEDRWILERTERP